MDNSSALETLKKYIKEKRLRFTPERAKILYKVIEMDNHFDIEELYKKLKKTDKKVVLSTVYNTIELLTECGILKKYRFGTDHYRYEKALDKPNHHHLICLSCGKITEFVSKSLDTIENKISKSNNFIIQNSTFQIFGTCNECQKETQK